MRFTLAVVLVLLGCGDDDGVADGGPSADAGASDVPAMDAGEDSAADSATDSSDMDVAADAGGSDGGGDALMGSDAGPAGTPTWVGVGNWGLRAMSQDGETYTIIANPAQGNDHTPDLLRDVRWGGGVFVAVGGDRNSMVMRSADGVTWDEDRHPSGSQWKGGVAYGAGRWVSVGGVGTVIHSDDGGLTWMDNEERLPAAGRNITYAEGRFIAVGDNGMIAVSDDGLSWLDRSQGDLRLGVIEFGHGMWVAAGNNWNGSGFDTSCFVSTDTETWSVCPFSAGRYNGASLLPEGLVVTTDEGYDVWDGDDWSHSDVRVPDHVFEADGLYVGIRGREHWAGTSLDTMEEQNDAERGYRSFALGFAP